jgi:hypothetical protein
MRCDATKAMRSHCGHFQTFDHFQITTKPANRQMQRCNDATMQRCNDATTSSLRGLFGPMCMATTTLPNSPDYLSQATASVQPRRFGRPCIAALHFLGIICAVYDSKINCKCTIGCSFGEISFVEEVLGENDRGYGCFEQFSQVFHRSTLDIATVESRVWQIRIFTCSIMKVTESFSKNC